MNLKSLGSTTAALALCFGLATLAAPAGAGTDLRQSFGEILHQAAVESPQESPAAAGRLAEEPGQPLRPAPQPVPGAATGHRPRVYWSDSGAPVCPGPDAFHRGDLRQRLDTARGALDDSHLFPDGPADWYYDWDTGTYYVLRDGRWYVYAETRGWYDRDGNYWPGEWRDGRYRDGRYRGDNRYHDGDRYYRRGAYVRPIRPRHPCDCTGW